MNIFNRPTVVCSGIGLFLALAWLGGGCAASSGGSSTPKPGRGIAEYRKITGDARRAVAATVESLEALARPSTHTSPPHPALGGFDRAFGELELTSIRVRARAEAIIARGQAYFDEWHEQLTAGTNSVEALAEAEHYARLLERFQSVRGSSAEVRQEFQPFMAELREFRARLDTAPHWAGSESFRQELEGLLTSGRRVLQKLELISTALDEAETQLHATLAARR